MKNILEGIKDALEAIRIILILALLANGCAAAPIVYYGGVALIGAVGAYAGTEAAKSTPAPQQQQQPPAAQPAPPPVAQAPPETPAPKPMVMAKITPLPAEKTFDSGATLSDARRAKKEQDLAGRIFQDSSSKAWFLEDEEGCFWKLRGGQFVKI